jgi:transposase-like protein
MSLNKIMLAEMYLNEQMSIPDIAAHTGMGKSTVRYHLLKQGVQLRNASESIALVKHKISAAHKGRKRTVSQETRKKMSEARKKHSEQHARGYDLHRGYVRILVGENKDRPAHVVIMEQHIGRKLQKHEVVHHINGRRDDNRLENLQLMTRSEHSRLHANERQSQGRNYDISRETKRGENHPKAKLKSEDVKLIRESNERVCILARRYGVSWTTIKNIKLNKIWRNNNVS